MKMEKNLIFQKKLSQADLAFWNGNLEREKERLKGLLVFSKGVEHSATMDAKRNIKRYESKVREIERSFKEDKP